MRIRSLCPVAHLVVCAGFLVTSPSALADSLHCPGDINGDGVPELTLVERYPVRVRVKDLNGNWINGFGSGGAPIADTELMQDTNANGAPELVILHADQDPYRADVVAEADVRDLLTGQQLARIIFSGDLQFLRELEIEIVSDQNENGIPEVAAFGPDTLRVETRDGLSGQLLGDVQFSQYVDSGEDLTIYPDFFGEGSETLGVLLDQFERSDLIEIRDVLTGALVRQIWFGKNWKVWGQRLIGDINGNDSSEVAVLRTRLDDRGGSRQYYADVHVQIRDTQTGRRINTVGFAKNYVPTGFTAIGDLNGNNADELVVFSEAYGFNARQIVIKDSKTGELLRRIFLRQKGYIDNTLFYGVCDDSDGNGAEEFLMREGNKVFLIDSRTAARVATVWFK